MTDFGQDWPSVRWKCGHSTFDMSGDRRRCAWPAKRMMTASASRAKCNAVGPPLDGRVRPHSNCKRRRFSHGEPHWRNLIHRGGRQPRATRCGETLASSKQTSDSSMYSYSSGMFKQMTFLSPMNLRQRLASLLWCARSMTKITSAQARSSGPTGTLADSCTPADSHSTPCHLAKMASAVGLRRRFCEQTKRARMGALVRPNVRGQRQATCAAKRQPDVACPRGPTS